MTIDGGCWQIHLPEILVLLASNACNALYYHNLTQHQYDFIVQRNLFIYGLFN